MTLRGIPQGVPVGMQNAVNGTPLVVNLTTIAGGTNQNGYIATTDFQIVTTADGTNNSITLPDPNKYGGAIGDMFTVINSASGQTIKVFPPTGGNISAGGANTANNLLVNKANNYYLVSFTSTTSVWTVDAGA